MMAETAPPLSTPASDAVIELRGVSKSFGTAVALEHVDLEICDGEFVVLLGPSGCGKSTLLRIIAGLEKVSEGRVFVGSADVTADPPGERDLAFVFQSYALYPHMTVRRNMAFPLLMERFRWWHQLPGLAWFLFRLDRRDESIVDRVGEAASMLGLTELLDRHPRTLSGGQRQRVALGRALVRDPAAFLMDEPLSNLDAKLRQQMRVGLRELHAAVGRTIVYVTHDQVEAMTMGTKIVVMDTGKIVQVGSPAEIYRRPASTYVAGFVGSPPMNILPAQLQGNAAGDISIEAFTGAIRCTATGEFEQPASSEEVLAGVRPEDIVLQPISGTPKPSRWCEARVHLVEDLGGESIVQLLPAENGEKRRRLFDDNAGADGENDDVLTVKVTGPVPSTGSLVEVTVKTGGDVTIFERSTGRRLGTAVARRTADY